MFILSVKELFASIKINLESTFPFVIVKGAVINLNYDASGNLYFNLKDDDTSIACVCWRGKLNKLTINPQEFDLKNKEIIIKGQLNVYKNATRISIVVIDITMQQEAAYHLLLEEQEQRLRAAGYFDEEHKKSLPLWPSVIGLITSKEGDAVVDILQAIKNRFPAKILLYNSSVQGKNAAFEIIAALDYFNSLPESKKPKVIIITRGGGSFEDLLPFNEEALVKAIFNSTLPVVTAIGHSKNISLADLAADKYATTPTAAAELVASNTISDYKKCLFNTKFALKEALKTKIKTCGLQQRLLEAKIFDPNWYLRLRSNQVNELQKLSLFLLKQQYQKYAAILKNLQGELPITVFNYISSKKKALLQLKITTPKLKNIAADYTIKLLNLKSSILQTTKTYLNNLKTKLELLHSNLVIGSYHITYKLEQCKFITSALNKEITISYKQKFSNYLHINSLLQSLSYNSVLKRGYTLIKETSNSSLIKTSSALKNKSTFEIIFYDKAVKITKKP